MNNRAFGVEIECQTPGYGYDGAKNLLNENGFHAWADNVYHDGSEIEIPSPILRGAQGFAELKAVMDLLVANDFTTTYRDGMHVHHDTRDLSLHDVKRIAQSWKNNQIVINTFVDPYRLGCDWCKNLTNEDIAAIQNEIDEEPYASEEHEKYKSLSLANRSYTGTIELRLHEGTLDFEKARAWILFGQAFISNVASRRRVLNRLTKEQLLTRTRVPASAKKNLLAR